MGIAVLVLGASGTGKSTSLRNFTAEEVGIFNVANKPLPFRSKLPVVNNATYKTIIAGILKGSRKAYVIDDSQYLMANEEFARAKETGYGKFTDIAIHFKELLDVIVAAPDDTIVYLLHHTEVGDDGRLKAKTVGKMLDNHLTVEGMFSIVLCTQTDGEQFQFLTKPDGYSPAKTPLEMFEDKLIPNDLKLVDTTIREYYGFISSKKEK